MLFTFKAIIYEPCCLATKVRCFMLSLTLTREFAEVWWLVMAAECRWFLTAGKWTVSWLFPSNGTSGMLWQRNSCCFVRKTYCFSRFYCRHRCHYFRLFLNKIHLWKYLTNYFWLRNQKIQAYTRQIAVFVTQVLEFFIETQTVEAFSKVKIRVSWSVGRSAPC